MGIRTILGVVAVIIVVFGGLIGSRLGQSKHGGEILTSAKALVSKADGYGKDPAYFDYICEAAHERAMEKAYTPGYKGRRGRGQDAVLDVDLYCRTLFEKMIERANIDRSTHIAKAVEKLQREWDEGKHEF